MRKAIIYTRFSPRPDADQSKSCEKQEERCILYCGKKEYKIVGSFPDRNTSGKKLHRNALDCALACLEPGMVLIVDSPDRLARDMLTFLTIQHRIKEIGATVEYANGTTQPDTPEGRLYLGMLGLFAQYERERYAERTKMGLMKKKNNGQWLGKPPFGWQYDKKTKKLEKNLQEQKILNRIIHLSKLFDSREIASILGSEFGLFRGKPWSERTIRKIIRRENVS